MHPIGRVVLAVLAVFVLWTLARAFRTGRIFSEGMAFTLNEQPLLFSLAVATHGLIVVFCGWLAAGGEASAFVPWLMSH